MTRHRYAASIQVNILFKNIRTAKRGLGSAAGANVGSRLDAGKTALEALVPLLEYKLTEYEERAAESRQMMEKMGWADEPGGMLDSLAKGIKAVEDLMEKIRLAESPVEVENALASAEKWRENWLPR